jgi:ribosomal protein L35
MSTTKVKKLKLKTHKSSSKRFKVTGTGKLMHLPQGGGNGHSKSYKNRRQKSAVKGKNSLQNKSEQKRIRLILGK